MDLHLTKPYTHAPNISMATAKSNAPAPNAMNKPLVVGPIGQYTPTNAPMTRLVGEGWGAVRVAGQVVASVGFVSRPLFPRAPSHVAHLSALIRPQNPAAAVKVSEPIFHTRKGFPRPLVCCEGWQAGEVHHKMENDRSEIGSNNSG